MDKKNPPGQDGHPGQQEYDNMLKRGNKSTADSSKPKRVKFWDENPPVLKVLRVQDHYGHATQEHISGKEKNTSLRPSGKTDQGNLVIRVLPGPNEKNIELPKSN